jgi:CRISPR system Cascade subunit CasE
MFLHRIHLDPRCREARRDLADPYQMHSTLCRAFSTPDTKCPEGELLWRLEPESGRDGQPQILIQSRSTPDWNRINISGWLAHVDPAINLVEKIDLHTLHEGQRFRFRIRANPSVKRDGKRQGLMQLEDQERWLIRQGESHGFSLPKLVGFDFLDSTVARVDVRISQQQMLTGKQHTGNGIRIFSVLYDGVLILQNSQRLFTAIKGGIGHGKAMGLGLLSLVPLK